MFRSFFTGLVFLILTIPSLLFAAADLTALESVVAASERVQPGLQNYLATIETSRIKEMMATLAKDLPSDVKPPSPPVIKKFWQRKGKGLVYASSTQLAPNVEKMVQQISAALAIELNEMLLPPERAGQRQALVKGAKITSSDVALADKLIHHLEITFAQPTDLDQAFYVNDMRLPQNQIRSLAFDIDSTSETINELKIVADNGLQLTVETRYIEVAGGHMPERFKVTSPDGKIDDLFEVKFTDVEGYLLPSSILRTIRRPDVQESLEILFKDYRVNQPIPVDLLNSLNGK